MKFKRGILSLLFAFYMLSGTVLATELVNINTATKMELEMVNGIGSATADAIISYRNENGPFYDVSELIKVKGIGEKKLAKLSKQVTITKKK